jgi:hypothetical protein
VAGLLATGLMALACTSSGARRLEPVGRAGGPGTGTGTGPGMGLGMGPGIAAAPQVDRLADPADDVLVEQRLYRLVYDGGEGRVSLRVVLRLTAGVRYQMVVSDIAGRTLWGIDHYPEMTFLADHRERSYCVASPDLPLSSLHPDEVSLDALPRVLAGELPVAVPADAGDDFTDAAGSHWRRSVDDGGALRSWTLFDADGPAVWWTRQEGGGILSRRGGEQYRWTLVVAEPAGGAPPGIVPAGFTDTDCYRTPCFDGGCDD